MDQISYFVLLSAPRKLAKHSLKMSRVPSSPRRKTPVFETDKQKYTFFIQQIRSVEKPEKETYSRVTFDAIYIHRITNTPGGA